MIFTYDISIGGVPFRARISECDKNFDQERRQYILLSLLAKTINSRKRGTDTWLQNGNVAYDFAMELRASLCNLDCFHCEMSIFEKVMQGLIMQRLKDYGKVSRQGTGKKASAVASGSNMFCSFDDKTDDDKKPGGKCSRWSQVLRDKSVYSPDKMAEIRDEADLADRALGKLDEKTRQCFLWHSQGLKNTDIAQLLGIDESYVRKMNKATATMLREQLG